MLVLSKKTAHTTTGSMKKLIALHKDDLEKHTNLDMSAVENVTYLNEFDREIQ